MEWINKWKKKNKTTMLQRRVGRRLWHRNGRGRNGNGDKIGGDGEATHIYTRVSAAVAAAMMMMIFQWYELIYLALLYLPSSSSAAATATATETRSGHQKRRTDLCYFWGETIRNDVDGHCGWRRPRSSSTSSSSSDSSSGINRINDSTSAIPATKHHQYKAKRFIISIPAIHSWQLHGIRTVPTSP